jgi:hypothetical protein
MPSKTLRIIGRVIVVLAALLVVYRVIKMVRNYILFKNVKKNTRVLDTTNGILRGVYEYIKSPEKGKL